MREQAEQMHSPHQYGFVPGKSTIDALLKYKNTIVQSRSKYIMTIFVDIKGAFDNVWWPGLIKNMRNKNLPQHIIALTKSYLTNRNVTITQGSTTVLKQCTKGCPQGSVLGPTL